MTATVGAEEPQGDDAPTERTRQRIDPSAVCVIGVGQHTWHPGDPELVDGCAPEPLAMWEQVVREAADDAGSARAAGVVSRLGALRVIYTQAWPYDDPPARLAARLGIEPKDQGYTGIGGTRPLQELRDLATAITRGDLDVGCVVGAEALATVRRLKKAGERAQWSHRNPERGMFPMEAPLLDTEISHEVFQAWLTFAMWDVGRRGALGIAPDDYQAQIGRTMAPLSDVAAANPRSWFGVAHTAGELTTVTPDNRMVGYPYPKLTVAVMDVDMAAAVIVASHEAAEALGVPADRRVYLRGACYGTDPWYLAEHNSFAEVPGMAEVSTEALRRAGIGLDDVAHLDLYSCFASSLHHACDALGITPDDPRGLTVTGGLPYFGGPGSNYLGHSIATMVERLRTDPGAFGLTSGVGMHMTKHAFAVWSTTPAAGAAAAVLGDEPAVQARLDGRGKKAIRPIAAGDATIATYSVVHGREGGSEWALAVCDLPEGDRCYAKALDPDLLAALESEEWVGRAVTLTDGGNNVNLITAER